MTARLDVLCAGYAAERVASTVVLIRDEGAVIVVDPGMVADRRRILDPLAQLGVDPAGVSDVVFSHHHPDHTLNAHYSPAPASTTSGRSIRTMCGQPGPLTGSSYHRR